MPFINLTEQDYYLSSYDNELKELDPKPIWVNTSQITFFYNGCICLGEKNISVKETPEEILRLIKEAENAK